MTIIKKDNINWEDYPLTPDNVNPPHYKTGGIETFDYIKAKLTEEQLEGYIIGNALKYLSRYRHKNGVEDIQKAEWYLRELIKIKG